MYVISIHAPAKGATLCESDSYSTGKISIHAPAKGATQCGQDGADNRMISIHAPAKGATFISLWESSPDSLFQSTLPRRERRWIPSRLSCPCDFNPRSREGSDIFYTLFRMVILYFNPRSREGSDYRTSELIQTTQYISIHAPAKGATMEFPFLKTGEAFQSTLPRRERHR